MSKFVVVTKTISDLKVKTSLQKKLPDFYPVECKEFDSIEVAMEAHPVAEIMTVERYKQFHESLDSTFEKAEIENKLPWWRKIF